MPDDEQVEWDIDVNQPIEREVPLVMYTNGQRNEIGTAKITVTPGEMAVTARISGVLPIFGLDSTGGAYSIGSEKEEPETEPEPTTKFERYIRKGLDGGEPR